MSGDRHGSTRTELMGKFWLCNQLAQAGVEIASPARDIGVDLIAYDADINWTLPIQLKVLNTGGLRVEAKYLSKPLGLVYVLLGDRDGGPVKRPETIAYLLTPEGAWALPSELGRNIGPDHDYYGFGGLPRRLLSRLDDFRVEPGDWARRLGDVATMTRSAGQRRGRGPTPMI